ncbi:hypothetical protein BDA99DRAFT_558566 [Phascolomyces articulosus]|uniref:Uncharacterized protein n=1 Tax=Phascolomyces articulosus TaxID=60185 RepID=A0AAD5K2P5_9FUNG|nr:hypothetical protein BDA99DRAFT_558566 [Phascolomyces articulosus]
MPKCMLKYKRQGGQWLDGKRIDIHYVLINPCLANIPPVIVEVQNTVENAFFRRLQQYCSHVYHMHNNVDPIALTLCVKTIRKEIVNDVKDSNSLEFKHDPTAKLLYSAAMHALDHQVQQNDATVDVLIYLCLETRNQFKRIYEAFYEDNEAGFKRPCAYTSAGIL